MVVTPLLGATVLVGCQQRQLGTTVGGEICTVNMHANPRSVHAGGHVALRRGPGCDKDHARQVTVWLGSPTAAQTSIGKATLGSDGAVTGTVVIPAGTRLGKYILSVDEETGCNDTLSCVGRPTSVVVHIR